MLDDVKEEVPPQSTDWYSSTCIFIFLSQESDQSAITRGKSESRGGRSYHSAIFTAQMASAAGAVDLGFC